MKDNDNISSQDYDSTGKPKAREDPNSPGEEPDPLELRKLSLTYDYLLFKIRDHIKTLTDQTYAAVLQRQELISKDYLEDQLQLSKQYKDIEELIRTCDDLEAEFMKIDQLEMFIEGFKERLGILERRLDTIRTENI
ncbi:uncharacterized protein LODBEIA_P28860 [Lodderomyces beijingensis]|uniref:Biogenesis of lysosome-related organelles complex 1 subunit CNL1 n=1 Tax=Lodderomyces beijingensis TaxID=1775926 RepID=A0ABP0ZMS7_9ASCO